jgi:hypothetical protein
LPIQGEYRIAAPRETVWAALNDATVLEACIPGCEALQKLSDTEIDARVNAQLGPVRSVFATRILLTEVDAPAGYTLTGEGKGAAGFGKGVARVELLEITEGTVLRYSADLRLGGKLAQVGSRLLEGATRQLADQFFDSLAKRLDAGAAKQPDADAAGALTAAAGAAARSRTWIVLGAAIAAVIAAIATWLLVR